MRAILQGDAELFSLGKKHTGLGGRTKLRDMKVLEGCSHPSWCQMMQTTLIGRGQDTEDFSKPKGRGPGQAPL